MLNCFLVLIGLLFLNYWNLGFGVFIVWYVKCIEFFLIVDLFCSLRINFGFLRCFFGFVGLGLDFGFVLGWGFGVGFGGGFDFFIWVVVGEIEVLIIGSGFLEILVGFDLEVWRKVLWLIFKILIFLFFI